MSQLISRRAAVQSLAVLGIGTTAFQRALAAQLTTAETLSIDMIRQAEWIADIELDDQQREQIVDSLRRNLQNARKLRGTPVDADTLPSLVFRPDFFYAQAHSERLPTAPDKLSGELSLEGTVRLSWSQSTKLPLISESELPFTSLATQASLLAAKELSSRELTDMYLKRLQTYDPMLKCVVTMLEEHARQAADAADARRARRQTRGILDGIPWVAKDLIAVPPFKTTWGAAPFRDQVRHAPATVATRLADAGAVLLAKVTLGALAWGDKWFGGMTRNPWNLEQGSSGSSAGSAAAVAAGLATFAIGSETLGSIVSPTTRCRTSGLRPTFGRISRAGCMPLAWSMDKLGPIARWADDLAHVFGHLLGEDGRDPTVVQRGFQWPSSKPLSQFRIGVATGELKPIESQAVEFLRSAGATIKDIDLSTTLPLSAMNFILGVEAATVFDDTFREHPHADYGNWPNTFRESQFIPAIQYLRANRLRSQLIVETEKKLAEVDVVLGGNDLLLTNLTGHPSLVVACGTDVSEDGTKQPAVLKLTAAAYHEEHLLHVAAAIQAALPPQPTQPKLAGAVEQ